MVTPHSMNRRDFSLKAAYAGVLPAIAATGSWGSAKAAESNQEVNESATHAIDLLNRTAHDRSLKDEDVLPPNKTALIIIDMMNLFCDPKWMSGGNAQTEAWLIEEFATIIPNLQQALEAFRKAKGLVVHVVNAKWTLDGREVVPYQRGRDYDLFDTERMSVIDALRPRPGEIQIRKVASSAFTATGLDFMLRNAGIEHVVLGGQYGSACVFYTLIQSREFGFNNYWMDDAILYGGEHSRTVFRPMACAYWARLATTDQVVRALTVSS